MRRPPKPKIAGSNPATPAFYFTRNSIFANSQVKRPILKQHDHHNGRDRMDEEKSTTAKQAERAHNILPDPYGSGFIRTDNPLERTLEKWEVQERRRLQAGKFARNKFLMMLRIMFGFSIAIVALFTALIPSESVTNPLQVFLIWFVPVGMAILPPLLASESMWSATQAKLSLRELGSLHMTHKQSLRSQPGMDRVLEGLIDVRRHIWTNVSLGMMALFLLGFATAITVDTIAWNLALLVAMTLGFAHMFHSIFTSETVRQQGDLMPYLAHHSPTHHPTQLGSILSEMLVLHLDPDLTIEWNEWMKNFNESVLPGFDKAQSWERLLYVLYLEMKSEISSSEALDEIKEFIRNDAIEEMILNRNNLFHWRSFQRLISHARNWQPGAFQLLERLQLDLISGRPEYLRSEWRMDVALDKICVGGAGHLFIALNNQSFEEKVARIEVICPDGEPLSRDHRFEVAPCPPPTGPVLLRNDGENDALDWMPRYLQRGVVLWLSIAWNKTNNSLQNVQVILRDSEGIVIESLVLQTYSTRGVNQNNWNKKKEEERVRKLSLRPFPNFTD
jgi:hypothetical protein